MGDVLITELAGAVLHLRLHRPERRNALNTRLLGELGAALTQAATRRDVRAVLIVGAGGHFAAGADISEIADKSSAQATTDPRKASWAAIRAFPKPIVAGVEGYCLGGGCELAMMADMIVTDTDARFGLPETNLGLIPGAGGVQRLTALIGRARAARMILTGEVIDGQTAHEWGLAAFLAEGAVADEASALAERLSRRAPLALAAAKTALIAAAEAPLTEGFAQERAAFEGLLDSTDKAEGIAAFRDKRRPDFKGR